MPSDTERIIRIKQAAEAELLGRPGVVGVDVGLKYVAGERTDEIVIRVHVTQKGEVPAEQRIPETIDGVRTDVLEGRYEQLSDSKMFRPVVGGISIGPTVGLQGKTGTLGVIVTDNATQYRLALTNHHVLFDGRETESLNVSQPSAGDLPPFGLIIGSSSRSKYNEKVDAALVTLNSPVTRGCWVADMSPVTGTGEPELAMTVQKRGRTTEWTYGTIDGVNGTFTQPGSQGTLTMTGQFSIAADPVRTGTVFAAGGDSGSAIVTEGGQVIGLLHGGSVSGNTTRGWATPISVVLRELDVTMGLEGIGGHNFAGLDQAAAFDLGSTGKPDHLVFFRSGQSIKPLNATRLVSVVAHQGTNFPYLYRREGDAAAIAGYDFTSGSDRMFAFDYSGDLARAGTVLDHLALYRPGEGLFQIVGTKPTADGSVDFERVFPPMAAGANPPGGIAGYDLGRSSDRAFAFDYLSTGKLDHIVLYRPAEHICWVVGRKRDASGEPVDPPVFERLYPAASEGPDPKTRGIGGYDLDGTTDRAFAFDYDGSGKQDHIVLYRPGSHICWIIGRKKDSQGTALNPPVFERVYPPASEGPDPETKGIGGYDLDSTSDRAFAFDYEGTGKLDHIVLYRPGTGIVWVVGRKKDASGKPVNPPVFERLYPAASEGPDPKTRGIGGYDLTSEVDRALAFDYQGTGKLDHIVLYRPGQTNICWIVGRKGASSTFESVYRAWHDPE